MKRPFNPADLASIFEVLDKHAETQPSPLYDQALSAALHLLEGGDVESADAVARILIAPGRLHDAAAAYKWFYIGLSQQGFTTTYQNEYEEQGTSYLGPAGDFRNEDEVSMCIGELGLSALRRLDAEAEEWLRAKGLSGRA